jgi:cyclic pyranopterin monophosphate synthase
MGRSSSPTTVRCAAMKSQKLSHLTDDGAVHMVDVIGKAVTHRTARASATVLATRATLRLLKSGKTPKGDVLAIVRVAGIQAAKATSQLIPLCHPLPLTSVNIEIELRAFRVEITATCETLGRTGVEMEALTAASVAALTLYDMLKAVDKSMSFEVRLEEKRGGRSGAYVRAKP